MKTTCLINCFNYAEYLGAAVESAVRQTVPFDQIIVVDDGSTDGSIESLRGLLARHEKLEIVAKPNAGQLSCFNEGFARATGDVIFFLDADDVYEPNYLAEALRVYERDAACDFVFCGQREFGVRDRVVLKSPVDRDLGYSVILTAYLREWIGARTSCLSMRRHVLDKILPLPFCDDWRTRADDCLVFGASLAGLENTTWRGRWWAIAYTPPIATVDARRTSTPCIAAGWQSIGCSSTWSESCRTTWPGWPIFTIASFARSPGPHCGSSGSMCALAVSRACPCLAAWHVWARWRCIWREIRGTRPPANVCEDRGRSKPAVKRSRCSHSRRRPAQRSTAH